MCNRGLQEEFCRPLKNLKELPMDKVKFVITNQVNNPYDWRDFKEERHKTISQFATDIVEYKASAGELNMDDMVAITFTCTDLNKMDEVMNSEETREEMRRHGVNKSTTLILHDFDYEDTLLPEED